MMDSRRIAELTASVPNVHATLRDKANVVGVGVGEKFTGGAGTGEIAYAVLVRDKKPASELAPADLVPSEIRGLSTDVVEVGVPIPRQNVTRIRPAPAGVSIGNARNGRSGTLGYFVRTEADRGGLYVLSNNHVMAAANLASVGDLILQPSAADGGQRRRDLIANLTRFPLIGGGRGADCAVARTTRTGRGAPVMVATLDGLSEPRTVPGWIGDETRGAGITTVDLDGDGVRELVVFHVDDASGGNRAYYRIGWRLGAPRRGHGGRA